MKLNVAISFALLLSIFVSTSESLPMSRKGWPAKAVGYRHLVSRPGHKSKDIFDIILKANSARKGRRPAQGIMAESTAPNQAEELFEGDIVMTEDIRTALKNSHTDVMTLPLEGKKCQRQRRGLTAHVQHKWPIVNGVVEVPYVIEASSAPDKTLIVQAMDHWHNKVPCITFVPRTSQADYLSFFSGQGCFSWVGRTGGNQRISIGSVCKVLGVIAHEIGHALGFWHEQSRPDRDKYVNILWNNILSAKVDDFKKISNADTNDLGVPYDLSSLMHYGPKAFSKSPDSLDTIESLDGSTDFGQRNGLSDKDVQQARLLYCPGTNVCQTLYTDLYVNCSSLVNNGYCDNENYKPFMNVNCKKSCICRVCEDKIPNCNAYVASGYCSSVIFKNTMAVKCRKSCSLCK